MPFHAEIPPVEIAASPAQVREVVLDFQNIPQWHSAHFKSIAVPSGKKPMDLVPGDKLAVSLNSLPLNFSPTIVENSAHRLKWSGGYSAIFKGDHVFEFLPSETNPGGTTFIHYEEFVGMFAHTMKPEKKSGQKNFAGFRAFNEDLKKKVEGSVQPKDE